MIVWSIEYETGIPEIDADHQRLFALVNEVSDGSKSDEDFPLGEVIVELADYVIYHFRREEALMLACDYEHVDIHKKEHQRLEETFLSFKQDFENDPRAFNVNGFTDFLTRWLRNHILVSDNDYIADIKHHIKKQQKLNFRLRRTSLRFE